MSHNSQLTYEEYIKVHKATEKVLAHRKNSHAYHDYMRAKGAAKAYRDYTLKKSSEIEDIKDYFTIAVNPSHWSSLSTSQFNNLQKIYGDVALKVELVDNNFSKMLSSQVLNNNVLSTGGACALESIDTKIIMMLLGDGAHKDSPKFYIEKMLSRFPTWTQITGSIIPKNGLNIFYDESFPWHLRLSEYGLTNPESKTQKTYDGIFNAVKRYIKLINPNNILVRVPFVDLNLKNNGFLSDWFKSTKLHLNNIESEYSLKNIAINPNNHLKSWVKYTYFGPKIIEITKKYLLDNYPIISAKYHVNEVSIHIRNKQIDHLDTERLNGWMHSIALKGKAERIVSLRKKQLLTKYHRLELSQYRWLLENIDDLPLGFTGFLDLAYNGFFLHEDTINSKELIKKMVKDGFNNDFFDSPLRLHSRNVESVIDLLSRFKNPNTVSFATNTLSELTRLKEKHKSICKKIKVLNSFIQSFTKAIKIFTDITISGSCLLDINEGFNKGVLTEVKRNLLKRVSYDTQYYLKSEKYRDLFINKVDFHKKIKIIINNLVFLEQGKGKIVTNSINERDNELIQLILISLPKIIKQSDADLKILKQQKNFLESTISILYRDVSQNITKQQSDILTPYVEILPLNRNLFVSYMQQLLFIPIIRTSYIAMVEIAENADLNNCEKETQIINYINKLFPIIEDCIKYIMNGGDYPWQSRFKT